MVSKRKITLIAITSILVFILSGCAKAIPSEDPNLKITEIASTVQADLTQIVALNLSPAPSITPTVAPTKIQATPTLSKSLPTATQTVQGVPTSSPGDDSKWIADVTYPDGTIVSANSAMVKTWTIENTGTTTWTQDYQLYYQDGLKGSNDIVLVKLTKSVAPLEQINISVPFTAPAADGSYSSWWKMYSARGFVFGEPISLKFNVGTVPNTPTPTPTPTPTTTH
ncbi:MAG: NBR1-Ig-like domain-containing protein [Chloroflexi bacterium]|nr:NBR1-Ig-like domain-containing protein [Chloroflexota bacterium]